MLPPERKDTTNVDPHAYAGKAASTVPVATTTHEESPREAEQEIYAPGERIPPHNDGVNHEEVYVHVRSFTTKGEIGKEFETALKGNAAMREQIIGHLSSQFTPQIIKDVEQLVKEGLSRDEAIGKVLQSLLMERMQRIRRTIKLAFLGVKLAIGALVFYIIYSIIT